MSSLLKTQWGLAIQRQCVFFRPEKCKKYVPMERQDYYKELERWFRGEPREAGWLVLDKGVPSHFVRTAGSRDYLSAELSVTVLGYNVLTAREDGNPHALSIFEKELEKQSGKYTYWSRRRPLVSAAIAQADVAGLCEVTRPMLEDILQDNPDFKLGAFVPKCGNYDGSAVLVNSRRCTVLCKVSSPIQAKHPQVFLACLVRDRITEEEWWQVVLHLKSDGVEPHMEMEARRVHEAEIVHAKIKRLSPRRPVVVVGDFNSDRLEYPHLEERHIPHVMNVFSEYECVLPLMPTYNHWRPAAFDHILVSGGTAVDARVPESRDVAPNNKQGSDHFPVYADVIFY